MDIFYLVKIFADWMILSLFRIPADSLLASAANFFIHSPLENLGLKAEDEGGSVSTFDKPRALVRGSRRLIYDTIKIFILVTVVIFAVAVVRTFLQPDKIRGILAHKNRFLGHVLAAISGTGIIFTGYLFNFILR